MEQLPVELANIRTPQERATEYMHYMRFLKLWDLLERCAAAAALETPDMGRDARKAWLTDYKVRHLRTTYLSSIDSPSLRLSLTRLGKKSYIS